MRLVQEGAEFRLPANELRRMRDDRLEQHARGVLPGGPGLLGAEEERIEGEFRQSALDAAVSGARVPITPELVKARVAGR